MRPADPSAPGKRLPGLTGLLTLAGLLVYAVLFWRERVFFGDAAHILFRVVQYGSLQIQEHRYGSFVTQLFPLAGTWLGLPLVALAFLYSISFNVFYFLAGLLLYRWKQYSFLLLLACYFTLCFSLGFYWTNNEVHQGTAWMLLFFGYSCSFSGSRWYWLVAPVLGFLAISSHPLIILSMGACWLFFAVAGLAPFNRWRGRGGLLAGIALLLVVARFYISKTSGGYDSDKMMFLDGLSLKNIPEALSNAASRAFAGRCITHYYVLPVIFLAGFAALLIFRKGKLAVLWLLLIAAFWLCLTLTFPDFTPWYSESDWVSLALVAALPFVFYALPALPVRMAVAVLVIVFTIRLVQIYQFRKPFVKRYALLQNMLTQMRTDGVYKMVLFTPNLSELYKRMFLIWELPSATLMLSGMEGDRPFRHVAVLQEGAAVPDAQTLLVPFNTLPLSQLNRRYFQVDSQSNYIRYDTDRFIPPGGID